MRYGTGIVLGGLLTACSGGGAGEKTAETDPTTFPDDTDTTVDTGPVTAGPIGGTTTAGDQTCVQLTGELDRVRADDDFLPFDGDPRTLQAWVRTVHNLDQVAVGYGRPAPRLGWMIGTRFGHPYVSSGSTPIIAEDVDIDDDRWHHLAATWDGREAVLYVDGELVASGPLEVETLDGDFIVGNTPSGDSKPWIGLIDDVKVFGRARLRQEFYAGDWEGDDISADYLMLFWDFEGVQGEEGFGVEVHDRSSTGIDGVTGGDADSPTFPSCR